MRLSTRGRFAITAMIDLASRQTPAPVPLQDLAVRHRISMSYLEQMFAKLRQHGLVESTRGPRRMNAKLCKKGCSRSHALRWPARVHPTRCLHWRRPGVARPD
ncbi:MAG: Rrf2 family transcriptional regulator [Burkholderiales bacterium]|nr:Rrf2 family transcriptional regulator [Burkholderiales bacterium]